METLAVISFDELLLDAKTLGNEIEATLVENGKKHLLNEWMTIGEYAKKYDLTIPFVSNWISRGIIPSDCVLETKNFNQAKLIKDKKYLG